MKKDYDDVALSDGCGYMVKRRPFEKYISEAPPVTRQVCAILRPRIRLALSSITEKHLP